MLNKQLTDRFKKETKLDVSKETAAKKYADALGVNYQTGYRTAMARHPEMFDGLNR